MLKWLLCRTGPYQITSKESCRQQIFLNSKNRLAFPVGCTSYYKVTACLGASISLQNVISHQFFRAAWKKTRQKQHVFRLEGLHKTVFDRIKKKLSKPPTTSFLLLQAEFMPPSPNQRFDFLQVTQLKEGSGVSCWWVLRPLGGAREGNANHSACNMWQRLNITGILF